jgi:hypothetical protein
MQDNCTCREYLSRRQFLKHSGQAALAAAGAVVLDAMLSNCATPSVKERTPVIYPPLKDHKVQPPADGCLVGFFRFYRPRHPQLKHTVDLGRIIDYYEKQVGQKPAIICLEQLFGLWGDFPMEDAVAAAVKSVITVIYASTGTSKLEDITNGKYDSGIRRFADCASEFGEKYGGFFFTPMWEMNIDKKYSAWPWSGEPKEFGRVWRHIWHIFEDGGANKYATWTPEYHIDFELGDYWPGDQYVDWIGLSAYNRKVHQQFYGHRDVKGLIFAAYNYFGSKHKDKPLMLEELGSTVGPDQPRWLEKGLQTIKSMPRLKAAIYWDSFNSQLQDDHCLSEESVIKLEKVLKDPYFKMAR